MTTHLMNTSEVAAELGISPASIHAYMHARSGPDARYRGVPQPHYFVGARHAPVWTAEDVQDWKVWYRTFQTQLLPRGPLPSRKPKTNG